MAKKVTIIGAVPDRRENPLNKPKLRVCGYARVSTGSRTQTESYATQVAYFTEKIGNNPLWEFAGMYADEAVTGTKVKGRNEFQAMIKACEDGDIDLILTKSVTRFARNTVECIQTIRKLKALGVGILFEKENINTLTEKSELLITILSSIAQGESEDFSGNNRWSIEKRFQDGTFITGTPAYGYRNDKNGNLVIVEEKAETVRWIFESYLNGLGTYVITKELNKKRIPTIRAGEKWHDSAVKDILRNPVYEGNRLLQRTYTESQFPFVRRANTGQRNQYLIEDDHEPVITHEEAEAVRNIMEYRSRTLKMDGGKYRNRYLFSGRIICSECGSHFRRQKINIGQPNEKVIWTCHRHVGDKNACPMKAIREDAVQRAFIVMWNKLYTNQGIILEPLLKDLMELSADMPDTEGMEQLDNEIQNLSGQSRILNQVMKKGYMDSAFFMESNNQLIGQLTECRRKKTLLARKKKRSKGIIQTQQMITLLAGQEKPVKEFDEKLFDLTVKEIHISKAHDITFCLHNGLELTEKEGGNADAVAYADRV
ncbi:MAG: recombinase family protein [Lachnospiraceae bacterium]|nr:recombinase family protein [Lachnospiraceae bacterium]